MKKIKYLLGCLVFGFGLLINQSFGIDVEVVNSYYFDGYDSNALINIPSYSYLYRFDTQIDIGSACASSSEAQVRGACFGNRKYGDKLLIDDKHCWGGRLQYPSYSYGFNNSIIGADFYTGWITYYAGSYGSFQYTANTDCNQFGDVKILLGSNSNFGINALYMNCLQGGSDCGKSPKYFFGGGGYITGSSYSTFKMSDIGNSIRFFYNSVTGQNIIDDLSLMNPIGNYHTVSWQYFTNTYSRNNWGYVIDNNSSYKGKHFGGLGMGYSFVFNRSNVNTGFISWGNLGFGTVRDNTFTFWNLGDFSFQDLVSSQTYGDGILILKKQQYSSNGNEGVIVISKNPNNIKQLLYQEFTCNTTEFDVLFYSGSNNHCLVLGQGLLSYNGSTDILPFTDTSSLYNISDNALLSYLFNTSDSMLGGTYSNGDTFCIGDDPTGNGFCFSKVSSSESIKDMYNAGLNFNISTSDQINQMIITKCLNDSDFALNQPVCNWITDQFQNVIALGSGQYMQYSVDGSGNLVVEIIEQAGLFDGFTGSVWVQNENGDWVTNCDSGWCNPNPDNFSGSQFLSGDILGTGYYDINSAIFFGCPYPYNGIFGFNGWDLKLGKFNILGPVNCFISAFNHGRSFDFLDNVGLFDFGPLINGNTQQHKILFRFFDILLSIGLLLLFGFISRIFK